MEGRIFLYAGRIHVGCDVEMKSDICAFLDISMLLAARNRRLCKNSKG